MDVLFSEFCLDEGWQRHQVPDHVDQNNCARECEVDGGVGEQVHHVVQVHAGVTVPFLEVVSSINVATSKSKKFKRTYTHGHLLRTAHKLRATNIEHLIGQL